MVSWRCSSLAVPPFLRKKSVSYPPLFAVYSLFRPSNLILAFVVSLETITTSEDYQEVLNIAVYEGERSLTKHNHYLGEFDLHGIPPARSGVPSILVKFEIDANGILKVSAEDKGSGSSGGVTITAEKGRLSEEDIARMVREAEQFAEEDRKMKARIDARHNLESYLYGLKHRLEDADDKKVSPADGKGLIDLIDETLEWMEKNADAGKVDYDEKQAEVERIANPILRSMYTGATEDAADDFEDEL